MSTGVLNGSPFSVRVPRGTSRLAVVSSELLSGVTVVGADMFQLNDIAQYTMSLSLRVTGAEVDVPYLVELYNETLGVAAQSGEGVATSNAAPIEQTFLFVLDNTNPAHVFSIRLTANYGGNPDYVMNLGAPVFKLVINPFFSPVPVGAQWNFISTPIGNQALNMGAFTTTWTWSSVNTGASNLFTVTDNGANIGTGYLFNAFTAVGSTLKPFHVGAGAVDAITVLNNGNVGIRTAAPGAFALDINGDARVQGKLTVTGIIDPTSIFLAGAANEVFINLTDGSAAPDAPAGEGRIRYVAATNVFQVSSNGNPFVTFAVAGPGATGNVVSASAPLFITANNVALGTAALPTTADATADVIWGTSALGKKALVLQGKAGQTANLLEIQASTGAVVAAVTPAGSLTVRGIAYTWPAADGAAGQALTTNGAGILTWAAGGGGGTVTNVTASVPLFSSGGATPNITLGTAALPPTPDVLSDVIWGSSATTQTPLSVQGKAGQTANLLEAQASTGSVVYAVNATGSVTIRSVPYIWPAADGTIGQALTTNGAGTLSWTTMAAGTVTAVTATAPLTSTGGATPDIKLGTAALPTTADANADVIWGTSATTKKALVLQAKVGQTASIQEWQDSLGVVQSEISASGDVLLNPARQLDTTAAGVLNIATTSATSVGIGGAVGGLGTLQVFINQGGATLHGAGSGVQYSSTVASRSQYRVNQYGNNVGVPGISAFKSRAATVGGLASVADGDVLFRATAVGVCGDNASIPLAGFISIQVPTGGTNATWVATDFALQLVPLAGPINSRREVFKVTSEAAIDLINGTTAPVTAAGHGAIRYNNGATAFEVSVNGGAWTQLLTSTNGVTGTGTTGKLTKWTGAGVIGDSIITETAGSLSIATTYGPFSIGGVDAFGRPQLWWYPNNAGNFGLLRLGSDASDGDPAGNVDSSGIVIWEPSIDRGCRIKSNRFGLTQSSTSANYYYRVDDAKLFYCLTPGGTDYRVYINLTTGFVGFGGVSAPLAAELFRVVGASQFDTSIQIGKPSVAQGSILLANTSANSVTLKSSNTTAAAWSLTLPVSAGTVGQVLTTDGSGVASWTTISATPTWDVILSPVGSQALAMAAYTTTWTWGAATGAGVNLFNLTDTAANTGTGYLLNVVTAAGSTLKPFHVGVNGVDSITVLANGAVGINTATPGAFALDVGGAISISGSNTTSFLNMGDGSAVAVSGASQGRIRYNGGTNIFELSQNGSAYSPLVSGGSIAANAIAYGTPSGGGLTSDALLTAAPLDGFGRPQIHDMRPNAMWRIGSWQEDGDPTSVTCTGMAQYGSNAPDLGPDNTQGGYFLTGPHGFGIYEIIVGVNGGNTFLECGFEDGGPQAPFGNDGFFVNSNAFLPQFCVLRSNGFVGVNGNTQLGAELFRVTGGAAQFDTSIQIGKPAVAQGSIIFANTTANSVTLKSSNATASAYTIELPINPGTVGQVLITDGTGITSWATVAAGSATWDAIMAPVGNQSLAMSTFTTNWTWGAATGAGVNLFNVTDSPANTGTGYLVNIFTAAGSALKPFHVGTNTVDSITVLANGSVGINTATPGAFALDVAGTMNLQSDLSVIGTISEKTVNGASLNIKSISEEVTIAAAAFTDSSTNLLPANSFIVCVAYRVTVVIPTAATFDVGVAIDTNRYGELISVAAGTTSTSFKLLVPLNPSMQNAAGTIRITPDAIPAAATGKVRITVYYIDCDAPTA